WGVPALLGTAAAPLGRLAGLGSRAVGWGGSCDVTVGSCREVLCACGYTRKQHLEEEAARPPAFQGTDLDPKLHVQERPTDAFGDIVFTGLGQKAGKYVRVSEDTEPDRLYQLMTQHWGLDVPSLLISVTGGAKDFHMKPRLKSVFRRGLVKVAQTTGSAARTQAGRAAAGNPRSLGRLGPTRGIPGCCLGLPRALMRGPGRATGDLAETPCTSRPQGTGHAGPRGGREEGAGLGLTGQGGSHNRLFLGAYGRSTWGPSPSALAGAWIITGGSHAGVMKQVGEAVHDFSLSGSCSQGKVVTIGVATWGAIHNRESLVYPRVKGLSAAHLRRLWSRGAADIGGSFPAEYVVDEEGQGQLTCLDSNHSHFLLVDDGTHGRYGVEIPLRTRLEQHISEQTKEQGGG
ncbi:Transient receptor potential cation channel subfamily M member 2, partial [Galemys pyrenaicus]